MGFCTRALVERQAVLPAVCSRKECFTSETPRAAGTPGGYDYSQRAREPSDTSPEEATVHHARCARKATPNTDLLTRVQTRKKQVCTPREPPRRGSRLRRRLRSGRPPGSRRARPRCPASWPPDPACCPGEPRRSSPRRSGSWSWSAGGGTSQSGAERC